MTPLQVAQTFLSMGIAKIPIHYRGKTPVIDWTLYQTQLPLDTELKQWFPGMMHNIGIIAGWQQLAIIDFDNFVEYGKWVAWMTKKGGYSATLVNIAYQVRTARGLHVYIRLPDATNMKIKDANGASLIDVQAVNKYVLGAGSVHPSGAIYTALKSGYIFPLVKTLSDVLPASLLTVQQLPDFVRPPFTPQQILSTTDDLWSVIDHPVMDASAVEAAKVQHRVEDFFPNKEKSSANGRFYKARCPFHDDTSPSFWIDTHNQICNCYVCNFHKPLDVINLVGRLYGLNNTEALFYLLRGGV